MFVIAIVCAAGFAPPVMAFSDTFCCDKPMLGLDATTNVTVTVCGLLFATADSTETLAVYVPAVSTPTVGRSVSVDGAVVVLSVAVVSQPAGCPAPYVIAAARPLSVAAPTFEMVTVCAAGDVPPTEASKPTDDADSAIMGTLVMTNVTMMFCALLVATGEATATVAVYEPGARTPTVEPSVSTAGAVVPPSDAVVSQPVGWPAA